MRDENRNKDCFEHSLLNINFEINACLQLSSFFIARFSVRVAGAAAQN